MIRHTDERGFTLMELMVVIVIVAILAAVAVPLYINYVKDAQRTEAKGAIGAIITAEQTYFQRWGGYTVDSTRISVDLTDVRHNWSFTLSSTDTTKNFDVLAKGLDGQQTAGLQVGVTCTRGQDPVWREQ